MLAKNKRKRLEKSIIWLVLYEYMQYKCIVHMYLMFINIYEVK